MINVYVYVLDTLADWEIGYITAELNSKRFFKKAAEEVVLKTVGLTSDAITTMGGLKVTPDCVIDDIVIEKNSLLILPGSNIWSDPKQNAIIGKALEFLAAGANVAAICGATLALAFTGALDNRPHASNGAGFLDMFCPSYKGTKFYVDDVAASDGNLITASGTGGLLFAKYILERLNVFSSDTLEAWYNYFKTGEASYFYALMQTLPAKN